MYTRTSTAIYELVQVGGNKLEDLKPHGQDKKDYIKWK